MKGGDKASISPHRYVAVQYNVIGNPVSYFAGDELPVVEKWGRLHTYGALKCFIYERKEAQ